eukprot:gene11805-26_t
MHHLRKLASCFARMDEPSPDPQPFSASTAVFNDTIPFQATIATMPSPAAPWKAFSKTS